MVPGPVPLMMPAAWAQGPASAADGLSQICGSCPLGATCAEGASPVDGDFSPIMIPPTWSQGPTSPVASLSQIRSSWSTVVAIACVDVVVDERGLAAGVMVGFLELPKELVAKLGEVVVGWARIDVAVDEGCIAAGVAVGFFVSPKELVAKVGEAVVGCAGVQSASRLCIARMLLGQICGTGKVSELAPPYL